MSYSGERVIFDADSHLMELPDFLTRHAPAAVRDRIPPIIESTTGTFEDGSRFDRGGHDEETQARLFAMGDNVTKGPKWHEALGAFNGAERAATLDLLGFRRQVVFSSFCARLIFEKLPADLRYEVAAAHNRAMAEFCDADDRLMGVAMVPLDDPDAALVEIAAAHDLGLTSIWISSDPPAGRSPGHIDHEVIWATLAERDLPFILHVGSSTLAIDDPWMNDGRPQVATARGGAEVIGSKDLTVIHQSAQRFVSVLVLDGVLERHRTLRGGVIELGAGWVPDMIRRLDHAATIWAKSEPHLALMKRLPSEQIRDQMRFTPYPFEAVSDIVDESFPELYLFSSDYPHAEGGRDPIGRFLRSTASLDVAVQEGFFATNFAGLYPNHG